ncbi:Cytochrome P450 52A8 [Candida tropicalis]
MIEQVVEYWYVVLPLVFILHKVFDMWHTRRLMKQLGAAPVTNQLHDNFFGIINGWKALKFKKEGRAQEYNDYKFANSKIPSVGTYVSTIFGTKLLVTKDPENIKALLATQFSDFSLGKRHTLFKPLLGDGIFTLDGEGWKHSRAMLRPQFAREQVAHVTSLEPHFQLLKKHILKNKGGFFDIQELFFRFTVDSATEFLFGESVHSLKDETIGYNQDDIDFVGRKDFAESFNKAQECLAIRTLVQDFYYLVNNQEFRDCNKSVHKFTNYYVQRALDATPEELEKQSGYVFLYELVKQTRDPNVLRDQSLNILLAGRDTTAGLLSFAVFELARNPHIWAKLREDVESQFGLGEESRIEEITFESLKRCEYLKAFLNETLRVYPSVPRNFRIATKNTTLPRGGGSDGNSPVLVKKGEAVSYGINSTHLDPVYYGDDAAEFRPERWNEPSTRKLGWAYLPFNGGPRICLGQQFALTEAGYVLVRLAQSFDTLELKPPVVYPPKRLTNLTMSLQDGTIVKID